MKTKFQKLMSIVIVVTVVTSQIACGSKMHRYNISLDQAELPKNYTYTVKPKNDEKIREINSSEMSETKKGLEIKTKDGSRSLMSQDIEYIYGLSDQPVERNIGEGVLVGSIAGGAVGLGVGLIMSFIRFAKGFCPNEADTSCDNYHNDGPWDVFQYMVYAPVAGVVVGGGVGAAIGAKKKKKQILIVPTVTPGQGGVNAGANLGVTF